MLIYEGNLHKKIGAISQLGAEKITFPPKPDRQTDIHTEGRTFAFYRVALLLKIRLLTICKNKPLKTGDFLKLIK